MNANYKENSKYQWKFNNGHDHDIGYWHNDHILAVEFSMGHEDLKTLTEQ